MRRADELLFEGRRVLVDATFREEDARRLFLDAGMRWGVSAILLLCRADPEVVRERLRSRRGDASDADWQIYLEATRRWEEPAPLTRAAQREIDTGREIGGSLASALDALREIGLAAGATDAAPHPGRGDEILLAVHG